MTNPRILNLLRESVAENRAEKLFLIEDIIKAKKLLNELNKPLATEKLFDSLYDTDIFELQKIQKDLEVNVKNHLNIVIK